MFLPKDLELFFYMNSVGFGKRQHNSVRIQVQQRVYYDNMGELLRIAVSRLDWPLGLAGPAYIVKRKVSPSVRLRGNQRESKRPLS